ncbi:MAG: S-layer homology domain-containing protein [Thermaerobacter sp.]|nr:S-layer homology domain-containing protein [Thermaerobacter sp.]
MAAGQGTSGARASASHGSQAKGHGLGLTGTQSGSGSAFGQSVEEAVYTALSSGQRGTALANAVHLVIATFKPNAKGIAVAEAVYQSVYGATNGGQTISPSFKDMGGASWAVPYVDALSNAGVVRGTTKTTFSPNADVTGAELLTMLARMQNWQAAAQTSQQPPANAQFLAKAPAFALQAIRAALSQGVLHGISGLSTPNMPLTRAQAVALLINSLGLNQAAQSDSTASIPLSGPVPTWARGAIALAVELGLVEGSDGQVLADQTLTRAQMAALLARVATLEALALSSQQSTQ